MKVTQRKEICTIWVVFLLFCEFSEKFHFEKWTDVNIKKILEKRYITTTLADQESINI